MLKNAINAMGFTVYVDWIEDAQLDRSQVNKKTAEKLRRRMDRSECLLYVSTQNSRESIWMPRELGCFDAKKGRVGILPISNERTSDFPEYHGRECLGLYYYLTFAPRNHNKSNGGKGRKTRMNTGFLV
jgi:hypothetical protein